MSETSALPSNREWLRRLVSGRPHQVIGGVERPYLRRWYLIPRNPVLNVYLHQFVRSDDDTALHDHPWWFVSLILKGGYDEVTDQDRSGLRRVARYRKVGSIAFRPAEWRHRVALLRRPCQVCEGSGIGYGQVPPDGRWMETDCGDCDGSGESAAEIPCWTLTFTGRRTRVWGFWCQPPLDAVAVVRRDLGVPDPARFVPWTEFVDGGCGES